jgi:hypothetical protein
LPDPPGIARVLGRQRTSAYELGNLPRRNGNAHDPLGTGPPVA